MIYRNSAYFERCLNRLHYFLRNEEALVCIPPLYFCCRELVEASNQPTLAKESLDAHYKKFEELFLEFGTKDISKLPYNRQLILYDIFDMLRNEPFSRESKRASYFTGRSSTPVSLPPVFDVYPVPKSLEAYFPPYDQYFKTLWTRIVKSYYYHELDTAFKLYQVCLDNFSSYLTQAQVSYLETIKLEYTTMNTFYDYFDKPGWIFDKEEDGITVEFKDFEDYKQVAIRIQGYFAIDVKHFLAIVSEIDLMSLYVPFCFDSFERKILARNAKIGTSKVRVPLLTDRETYFYAAGYDRIKTRGSVFLFSKTINEDYLYQQKYAFQVPDNTDLVRIDYKFFIIEYTPVTRTRARVRLASQVDSKLNFLPMFILNMTARIFAFQYFRKIIEISKNFKDSEWEKRINANPDIYNFFERKIKEYFEYGQKDI